MKNIGQGSLFDEAGESKRWHRVHAAPASGRGGCSLDIGPVRWRGEGGEQETKRELVRNVIGESTSIFKSLSKDEIIRLFD